MMTSLRDGCAIENEDEAVADEEPEENEAEESIIFEWLCWKVRQSAYKSVIVPKGSSHGRGV